MSEIDDLGDIADQCSLSTSGLGLLAKHNRKKPHMARCGSPEHMKGPNVRVQHRKGHKIEAACKADPMFYEIFAMDDRWDIIRAILKAVQDAAVSPAERGGAR